MTELEDIDINIHPDYRLGHWYIIGNPGSGKTSFQKSIMYDDMKRGHGLCFIDLHGDAAPQLLSLVPENRWNDVIYYDPTTPYCPRFNLFLLPYEPDKLADDIKDIFKTISESWGVRLDDILTNALLTLLYDIRDNGTPRTLLDLKNFFIRSDFRREIIQNIQRETIRDIWQYEYPDLNRTEIAPVLNKVNKLLRAETMIRDIFSEPENDLDFTKILNEGKILIVRLPKGKGAEAAQLLGTIFVRCFQQAALSRENIPEHQRLPFYLMVDEFQNLGSAPFESILTETRKFNVFLTLAHQLLSQVPALLQDHLFPIAKVMVSFRISAKDARHIQPEMHRTRKRYRVRERPGYKPISNFILFARGYLAEMYESYKKAAKKDPWAAQVSQEIAQAFHALNHENMDVQTLHEIVHKTYGFVPAFRDVWGERHEKKGIQLFPEVEFHEDVYPQPEHFTNLPPFDGFCKLDTADNVYKFRTYPAPQGNEAIKQAILAKHQRQYAERVARQKTTPPPPPPESPLPGAEEQPAARQYTPTRQKEPAAAPPPRKRKKPKADEDFLN